MTQKQFKDHMFRHNPAMKYLKKITKDYCELHKILDPLRYWGDQEYNLREYNEYSESITIETVQNGIRICYVQDDEMQELIVPVDFQLDGVFREELASLKEEHQLLLKKERVLLMKRYKSNAEINNLTNLSEKYKINITDAMKILEKEHNQNEKELQVIKLEVVQKYQEIVKKEKEIC